MTPKVAFQLANSLLEGYYLQEDLRRSQCNIRKPSTGQLTESWQKRFVSRHNAYLWTKQGYHINQLQMDGFLEDNIQAMYDMNYKTLMSARFTVRLLQDKYHYIDASKTEQHHSTQQVDQWVL